MKTDTSDVKDAFLPSLDEEFGTIIGLPSSPHIDGTLGVLLGNALDWANNQMSEKENKIRQLSRDAFEVTVEDGDVKRIEFDFTIVTVDGAFSLHYSCKPDSSNLQVKAI